MVELEALRQRLDNADRRIVEALADRLRIVDEVAALKGDTTGHPRDAEREASLLERVERLGAEYGLDAWFVSQLYREILAHSVRMQEEHLVDRDNPDRTAARLTVGYQGTDGCYSHLAATRHFAARKATPRYRGHESFRDLLEAVRDGTADLGVLPIENTTAGSINESYDLLARMGLKLVGEEVLEVRHCLLALRPVPLKHIRRIRSHPQALAQCSDFLGKLENCLIEAYADTAMACQALVNEQDLSQAAIAGEHAARHYDLTVIREGVANHEDNYTRFVVVAREAVQIDARIPCKTSILFATRHEEGALLKCLNALGRYHLNLTKLESRPRPARPWEYLFYVDFEGNLAEERVQRALAEVAKLTGELEVLGCYPSRRAEPVNTG